MDGSLTVSISELRALIMLFISISKMEEIEEANEMWKRIVQEVEDFPPSLLPEWWWYPNQIPLESNEKIEWTKWREETEKHSYQGWHEEGKPHSDSWIDDTHNTTSSSSMATTTTTTTNESNSDNSASSINSHSYSSYTQPEYFVDDKDSVGDACSTTTDLSCSGHSLVARHVDIFSSDLHLPDGLWWRQSSCKLRLFVDSETVIDLFRYTVSVKKNRERGIGSTRRTTSTTSELAALSSPLVSKTPSQSSKLKRKRGYKRGMKAWIAKIRKVDKEEREERRPTKTPKISFVWCERGIEKQVLY